MTREEAIKFLKLMRKAVSNFEEYGHDKASMVIECDKAEAIDMAIEALSSDTVSREAYHNLVTASNDIDRALREYQNKEENGELVSVVRCKECQYLDTEEDNWCLHFGYNVYDTDYCSYGERREP